MPGIFFLGFTVLEGPGIFFQYWAWWHLEYSSNIGHNGGSVWNILLRPQLGLSSDGCSSAAYSVPGIFFLGFTVLEGPGIFFQYWAWWHLEYSSNIGHNGGSVWNILLRPQLGLSSDGSQLLISSSLLETLPPPPLSVTASPTSLYPSSPSAIALLPAEPGDSAWCW